MDDAGIPSLIFRDVLDFPLADNASKSVIFGQNKIALLGDLIDVFKPY